MKSLRRELLNTVFVILGILSAGMGIKGFLLSNHLIDGGVTGVSMLLAKATGVPLWALLPLVNLPFIVIAFRLLGMAFALRSIFGIAGLSVVIAVVPFPTITSDLVLTAVFGGLSLGMGIGLAVRGRAVLDGTEIAALLISRRGLVKVGEVILAFNAVLFTAALAILGTGPALYSILTYLAAAKMIDYIIHGIDEYTNVTIVSDLHAAIRERITTDLGRGVTVYRGYGGKSGAEKDILSCVITRLEIGKVKAIIRDVDPLAFVVFSPLSGVEGGLVRRAPHSV